MTILRPRSTRIVATSSFPSGSVTVAAVSGDWIAYLDQSALQTDLRTEVLWRVTVRNLRSGETRVLATNGTRPDDLLPALQSQDGYIFWTSAEADLSAREQIWRPGWPSPRDLLRHVQMSPGTASIDGDTIVYLGPSATPDPRDGVGRDCWVVPLAGGEPRPATDNSLAISCASTDGVVVEAEHIDPAGVPPSSGIFDDPYRLSTHQKTGAVGVLRTGYFSSALITAAEGFVVWKATVGRRFLQSVADRRLRYRLAVDPAAGTASANGDELLVTALKEQGTLVQVFTLGRQPTRGVSPMS